jgi:tRNA threonylcarbamoyladenosine biosynthesis protein TsaB
MWLALETAGDQASVAVGWPGHVAGAAALGGSRQHAGALLGLVERACASAGGSLAEVEGIVVADGPGSFTGLRVAAAVAKALVRSRGLPLWTAPSLVALAAEVPAAGQGCVVAVSDALRGQLFATACRFRPGEVEILLPPAVYAPEQLAERCPLPDSLVVRAGGSCPLPAAWSGLETTTRAPAGGSLLGLIGVRGGVRRVLDPADWEPEYGRPAEAQTRWEEAHGRRLPDTPGTLR